MKNRIKKYIFVCVLSAMFVILFGGWTGGGVASLKHNGKANATFTVESDETESEFLKNLERTIGGYNDDSGDSDYIKIKSCSRKDGAYEVQLNFRRIDKVKAAGNYEWNSFSSFAEYAENRKLIENLAKGNWRNTWSLYYNGAAGSVQFDKNAEGQTKILPRTADGQKLSAEEFLNAADGAKKNEKIFVFRMPDMGNVRSLKITFPGTITRYAGNNVSLAGDDTIEIGSTKTVAALVHRYRLDINENGEEELKEELLTDVEVNAMLGYAVYEQSLSPAAIAGIAIFCAALGGGIAALAAALIARGKKVTAPLAEKIGGEKPLCGQGTGTAGKAETTEPAGTDTEPFYELQRAPAIKKESVEKPLVKKENYFAAGVADVFRGKTWKNICKNRWLYLIILPAILLVALFCYIPMAGIVIAFQDFNLLEGVSGSEWVGMKAFRRIFVEYSTANYLAVRNTIYIALIRIGTNFPLILIFSLLLHEIKSNSARSAIQAISYIPYFISWVALGGLANNLFTQDGGVLNKLLVSLGASEISWYNEPRYWWAILSISSLWKGMGWSTLIYMSAMGSINDELYEACTIDGGGRFRRMITVTLPGISNVITLQILLDVASLVRDDADQILAMTNSSPALDRTTSVIGTSILKSITSGSGYSGSTALGIVQGLVGLMLVLIMNRIVKKTDNEGLI